METMKSFRLEETESLVKWILKNPGKWNSVVDSDDMSNGKQFIELLQILKEEEFYQIIVVLLSLNENDEERHLCSREIEKVRYELIEENWSKETLIQVTDKIIDKIKINETQETNLN